MDGAITALLHALIYGRDSKALGIAKESRGVHLIRRKRPELLHVNVRGNVQLVGTSTL